MIIALENYRNTHKPVWHLYNLHNPDSPLCGRPVENLTGRYVVLNDILELDVLEGDRKLIACKLCKYAYARGE